MSIPFRERNPVVVGAISLAVVVGLILLAFNADKLPIIGGGTTYYADFTEAGGLKANDEVRIAGVRVGKVDSVSLDGDHVKVAFRIKGDTGFGTDTRAAIKVKTLLGAMFLSLEPAGPGQLDAGSEIPTTRTQSPYDVVQAFSGLARTSDRIDTGRLAQSLTTLADLTRDTPTNFRHALAGVSALSSNLASRDQQIGTLLQNLQSVSHTLNARDQDIVGLMRDSVGPVPGARPAAPVDPPPAAVDLGAVGGADPAGPAEPGRPQARADPPEQRGRRARQGLRRHRPEPAADGAVLPGLRQHAGQRAVVRHLHPEHPAGPAGGWLRCDPA